MTLYKKLSFVTSIGAIVLLLSVATTAYISTFSALERVMRERQLEVGRRIMDHIDRSLFEYYTEIQVLAEDQSVASAVLGQEADMAAFHERVAEIFQLQGSWERLLVVDGSGLIHVSTDDSDQQPGMRLHEDSEEYRAFLAAMSGEVYYSEILQPLETQGAYMIFAAPIVQAADGGDQTIGALLGYLPQVLFEDILRDDVSQSDFRLYTQYGALVAADEDGSDTELFAVDTEIRQAIDNDTLFYVSQAPGAMPDRLTTLTPSLGYLAYGGNHWVLAIQTPMTLVSYLTQNIVGNVVLVILPLALIVMTVILVQVKRFLRPIDEIAEATGFVAEGAFTPPLPVSSVDEAGGLTVAFNAMVGKLKKAYQKLNRDVQEKTTLLAKKEKLEEQSKAAIFNLLEDIQEEKKNVEMTVVERTQELQAEKARLLASINSLSFGFIIATLDHHVVLTNQAMLELLGATRNIHTVGDISSVLGEHVSLEQQIEGCLKQDGSCELKEIVFGAKILRGVVAPVLAENDVTGKEEMSGYVFMLEDITEAKAIERSKDEFFAIASHELRTPLTAIRGNSEMMLDMVKEKVSDPEMAEMISDIHEASIRLIGIVNDFLDSSRLEQGKVVVQNEKMDFLPIVQKTCHEIDSLAQAKGLTLTYVAPKEKTLMVLADPARIKQAVSNLIDNAVKYSDKGTVTVSVTTQNGFAVMSVADTGKGIAPEHQSLLFRKFQQAGEAVLTRDVSKGTGLGLYISRLLMQAMGGSIGLKQSTLGVGSVFELTIPMTKE